ncbi:hypothetical protein ACN4BK_05280 [Corynebacterium macclintockiae]
MADQLLRPAAVAEFLADQLLRWVWLTSCCAEYGYQLLLLM